jgi:gluconolactonase
MESKQTAFQAFHPSFQELIGEQARITLLEQKDWAFAHEAGVFFKDSGNVYFTSARLLEPDGSQKVVISKINLNESPPKSEVVNTDVLMANGGIKYKNGVLFCEQGDMERLGALSWMEDRPPYNVTTMVDSFQGRPFNSPNDIVVHRDGSTWFTDPIYGYMQKFKPKPSLPSQIYRYDPAIKAIRAVADGFVRPNGICFSPDQSVVYVSDTEQANGDGIFDQGKFASM